ncbi:MAG: uracil-DNA glycosylase [Candidatus Saccharibacteria bacterium]|nr:uracil-DNA glycosylase [Candidatus Saccharibacteria bacterium]
MSQLKRCAIFFILLIASCTSTITTTPPSSPTPTTSLDGEKNSDPTSNSNSNEPNHPKNLSKGNLAECEKLISSASWQTVSLYELTYQCQPSGWQEFFEKPEVRLELKRISSELESFITQGEDINPGVGSVFRALYAVAPSEIKSVIIGQDPTPAKGQATGLAFSLRPGTPANVVPSVQRVMLEAINEGHCMNMEDGDLSSWANQGVLLLNTALTIPCSNSEQFCTANGHKQVWSKFTGMLITHIDAIDSHFSYILWGGQAGGYATTINNSNHKVLRGGHPSPNANGAKFFCKNYFNCANKWLVTNGKNAISWETQKQCYPQEPCVWNNDDSVQCETSCVMSECE